MQDTTGGVRMDSYGPLHKGVLVLADQQELSYIKSVRTLEDLPGALNDMVW